MSVIGLNIEIQPVTELNKFYVGLKSLFETQLVGICIFSIIWRIHDVKINLLMAFYETP